jgi:hypothetical protein
MRRDGMPGEETRSTTNNRETREKDKGTRRQGEYSQCTFYPLSPSLFPFRIPFFLFHAVPDLHPSDVDAGQEQDQRRKNDQTRHRDPR